MDAAELLGLASVLPTSAGYKNDSKIITNAGVNEIDTIKIFTN